MSLPRYRTLDGDEVELPLAMGCWVIVPRALARFDPELAWTLDYEDAPAPEDADPRLDFSAGALLVPVDRWNEHAELEPNLASCRGAHRGLALAAATSQSASVASSPKRSLAARVGAVAARCVVLAIAALATAYLLAVGAWLWTLRDGISGPDVSTGLVLVGAAVLLAWLAGVTAVEWTWNAPARRADRTWPDWRGAVLHLTDDPLGILRVGMALQVTGFAALVLVH
jgi:hypothetical protein